MRKRQPNKAAAVLAAALGAALVISRALLRGEHSPVLQYAALGVTLLLALAYLASVFFIKPKKPEQKPAAGGARGAQLDDWKKSGLIDQAEYEALLRREEEQRRG
ncbi:MAG: hypothetical protein IJJ43_08540 [Oscillospiraceae bacterium]|nr:hypothetical protein [Oscillospiraceae bacterium]MBQ6466300.1 hypothetical protein [Oscillospiraceae bacterium]